MTLVKLGYEPKLKKWKELPLDFIEKEYNGFMVLKFHVKLKEILDVCLKMKSRGWDNLILIDGKRRAGKSTLAFQVAYYLDPHLTINSFVSGLENAPKQIEEAKDESSLVFDEGTLVANSKDAMSKQSKQLHKIIDVCGQKRLSLIFCMPSFTSISREIVCNHAMFLLRIGVSRKSLERGKFRLYKNKRMKQLYDIMKKDPRFAKKVKHSFNGKFEDFHLPFEEEYFALKRKSMHEAINPTSNKTSNQTKTPNISEITTHMMMRFREQCPDVPVRILAKGFCMNEREFYRRQVAYLTMRTDSLTYNILTPNSQMQPPEKEEQPNK